MNIPRKRKTALARHLDALNASNARNPAAKAPEAGRPASSHAGRGWEAEVADPPVERPRADTARDASPPDAGTSMIKIVRRSKMDAFLHLIGVKPDREVAEMAGVTSENVRAYRKRRGIPAQWREEGAYAPRKPRSTLAPSVPQADPQAFPRAIEAVRPVAGTRGFLVVGDDDEEFVVVADDIAQAAALAVARLAARKPSGRVVSIQYLAEMLGG